MSLNVEISALVERLEPHNTLDPPNGLWIQSDEGEMVYDPDSQGGGADWCEKCVDDVIMRLNLYTPGPTTYRAIWNDPCSENDILPRCAKCGTVLAGWPTDYCQSDELSYFEKESDFRPSLENIHVICMMLWNLQWGEEDEQGTRVAWKKIGERLLEKIEAAANA